MTSESILRKISEKCTEGKQFRSEHIKIMDELISSMEMDYETEKQTIESAISFLEERKSKESKILVKMDIAHCMGILRNQLYEFESPKNNQEDTIDTESIIKRIAKEKLEGLKKDEYNKIINELLSKMDKSYENEIDTIQSGLRVLKTMQKESDFKYYIVMLKQDLSQSLKKPKSEPKPEPERPKEKNIKGFISDLIVFEKDGQYEKVLELIQDIKNKPKEGSAFGSYLNDKELREIISFESKFIERLKDLAQDEKIFEAWRVQDSLILDYVKNPKIKVIQSIELIESIYRAIKDDLNNQIYKETVTHKQADWIEKYSSGVTRLENIDSASPNYDENETEEVKVCVGDLLEVELLLEDTGFLDRNIDINNLDINSKAPLTDKEIGDWIAFSIHGIYEYIKSKINLYKDYRKIYIQINCSTFLLKDLGWKNKQYYVDDGKIPKGSSIFNLTASGKKIKAKENNIQYKASGYHIPVHAAGHHDMFFEDLGDNFQREDSIVIVENSGLVSEFAEIEDRKEALAHYNWHIKDEFEEIGFTKYGAWEELASFIGRLETNELRKIYFDCDDYAETTWAVLLYHDKDFVTLVTN